MISELKDDEIMDFLMTSDFESEYKPEELKYLLYKWRYFYRLLQGNSERLNRTQRLKLRNYNKNWTLVKIKNKYY